MTRFFLRKLSIEGFRGINNCQEPLVLKFKHDAVNSIHAPNGFGKSSIFEAIYFAIFGEIPRLQALKEGEQGNTYIINKFHSSQTASIYLEFESDDEIENIKINVTQDEHGSRTIESQSGHPNPEAFLNSLREDFVLVDYAQFNRFVDSSALERGRSFASLVGLSRYSQLRQALDGVKDTRNINSDLGLAQCETIVKSDEKNLEGIKNRVLAAFHEVTGESYLI